MYLCNTIFLHSEIPSRMRPILSVKLRQVRDIVSAVVEEKKVTVYYRKTLDLRALKLFIRAFEEKYGRKKEEKLELKSWLKSKTRDSILTLSLFQ